MESTDGSNLKSDFVLGFSISRLGKGSMWNTPEFEYRHLYGGPFLNSLAILFPLTPPGSISLDLSRGVSEGLRFGLYR